MNLEFVRATDVFFMLTKEPLPVAHLQCDLDLAAQSVRAKISRMWDQGHSSHSDDLICQLTIDSSDRIVSVINGREFFAVEHLAAY
jgi:hypothetical protein